MKKQLLKSLTLTLALSIMPMALHAMNERQQANNNTNQAERDLQRARHAYVYGLATIPLVIEGFQSAFYPTKVFHEYGHAAMAEALHPGSVQHIEIMSKTPHILFNSTEFTPNQNMAVFIAGPIAGSLGCYAAAKYLQFICAYQKKKNVRDALQETHNTPLLANPSESLFITGLQLGLGTCVFGQFANMMIFKCGSDGDQFLSTLLYEKRNQTIPPSRAIPWNVTLSAGIGTALGIASIHCADHACQKIRGRDLGSTIDDLIDNLIDNLISTPNQEPSQNLRLESSTKSIRNPLNAFRKAAKDPLLKHIFPKFY